MSRSLVSGPVLRCCEAVSIYSLWLLRDVGGRNRPTIRALSAVCARDVAWQGSVPRLCLSAMRSST